MLSPLQTVSCGEDWRGGTGRRQTWKRGGVLVVSFQVLDWAAHADGRLRQSTEAGARAAPPAMPMMLRRRLTPLGQAAIAAAYGAGAKAGVHYVFASRHGEFQRSLRVLEALAAEQPLSPADFSLCVHNALAGLLSIATGALAGHTAIAAGPDSLAGGLLEAAALLAADPATPVLLAYFDDDLPAPYDAFQLEPAAGPLALAVLLGSPSVDCAAIQFVATPRLSAPSSATALPARAFLRFLAENLPSAEAGGARFQVAWCRAT